MSVPLRVVPSSTGCLQRGVRASGSFQDRTRKLGSFSMWPPSIRVFSNESALHIRWSKYWSFSFNISPSNEYSGLISFRIDWFDLLAIQGTLKSLLQHHNLKVSVFCTRWPKYWSFSFSISPSSEYSGLISFRIDSFDLLAVQGTLKSLLQHHSLKASVFQCSAFFMFQLSHWYMTTRKTIGLTTWTFVSKVMSPSPDYLPFISNHYTDGTNPCFLHLNRWIN